MDMVFDLFCELNASDEQLEFPIVYTSAKMGYAKLERSESSSMEPLFAVVESNVHPPKGDGNAPFQMLVTNIDYNDYIGRIATGKIFNGKVTPAKHWPWSGVTASSPRAHQQAAGLRRAEAGGDRRGGHRRHHHRGRL